MHTNINFVATFTDIVAIIFFLSFFLLKRLYFQHKFLTENLGSFHIFKLGSNIFCIIDEGVAGLIYN